MFDLTMVSFDGTEVCEVSISILSDLKKVIKQNHVDG